MQYLAEQDPAIADTREYGDGAALILCATCCGLLGRGVVSIVLFRKSSPFNLLLHGHPK